jgi:tetratricopeptide (TPR) repeat protein
MKKHYILLTLMTFVATQASAGTSALTVTSPGRPPEARLKVKTSKVPTYSLSEKGSKVKSIPKLDIGEESKISAADVVPVATSEARDAKLTPIKRNISPEVVLVPALKNLPIFAKAKNLTTPENISRIPEVKTLATLPDLKTTEAEAKVEKIQEMTPGDHKLLQALIFLEIHKNYALAMGLLADLLNEPGHRIDSLYHYGLTAKGLGLNTEFRESMLKVAHEAKSKEWKVNATRQLVENIGLLEVSDIKNIEPLVQQADLETGDQAQYQLYRAKYFLNEGQLTQVDESLALIPEKSDFHTEALLVSGIFNYRRGKLDEALNDLTEVMKVSDQRWPLRSVAAITLARMYFQKSMFKDAFQAYLQVDKSDALWLQAMVEQAWTQILSEDYEGAAGNMFSLHTDFFKNAFSPESYVVRTVGYLNLCQYGDGMHVLEEMKKRYAPWKSKMEDYKSTHKQSLAYYDTVKNWIKNSDLKEVDGLPRSFIVELARHPGFLKVQGQINNMEDEISRFNKVTLDLVRMDKELSQKQNEIIKDSKTSEERERRLTQVKADQAVAKKARTSIAEVRAAAIKRIEKEKVSLRDEAGQAIQSRFKDIAASLNKVLEQNEVLQYEVYAGAGEHIRYQMAGGDVNTKDREQLKVQDGKSLNWKFKGEVWEDEVGHYRSSLKNVCPKDTASN